MEITVNAAVSADGKISNRKREQVEISSSEDFRRVDEMRAESDAIMVGVGTVLADDPSLTTDAGPDPVPVVADSRARMPPDARLIENAVDTRPVVAVTEDAPGGRVEALDRRSRVVEAGEERVDLRKLVEYLESLGYGSLMVEGGGELVYSFFKEDLVDRFILYVGDTVIGGRDSPTIVDGEGFLEDYPELELVSVEEMSGGALLEWSLDRR
ncbi:MAG: 2,5-diamino-6-(ribosylamino)-4(3H)-pyrimidinone 5'-phosphate reductase [Halobacteria archaeon]